MFFGTSKYARSKRPITCKINNEPGFKRDNVVSVKPQSSSGVTFKDLKNLNEKKLVKGKPIQNCWNKCQTLTPKPSLKIVPREPNGLPLQICKVLKGAGYIIGKSIGEGSYCKVRLAQKATENGFVKSIACKMIDKRKASKEFVVKFLPRELNIIKKIIHPNIVSIYDVFQLEDYVFIFMELCERGDLLDYIRAKGPLPESRAKHFFRQIVSAVEYVHSLDIAHRDLKCENMLLARNDSVKITDFGFARWCKDDKGKRILSETYCGSAAYAAPEILQGHKYNPKMYDIWSLGCVLFIMLTATMPFDDSNINEMLDIQLNHCLKFPSKVDNKISVNAKKLVLHLLEADITRRATLPQISRSIWLTQQVPMKQTLHALL